MVIDFTGLLAVALSLAIPIVAVLGAYIVAIKRKASETELRKAIIENHTDAESIKLLIEEPEKKNKYSMLRGGCMFIGVGLGVAVNYLLGITPKHNINFWLIIACFVGIGMLVSFIIETKMQKKQEETDDTREGQG